MKGEVFPVVSVYSEGVDVQLAANLSKYRVEMELLGFIKKTKLLALLWGARVGACLLFFCIVICGEEGVDIAGIREHLEEASSRDV